MPYSVAIGGDMEPLVKDSRLEKIFYQFQQFREFPPGTAFATYIQDPTDKDPRRLAVFVVYSDHPRANKRAITPHKLITMSAMPYEHWKEMEKEHRHYANLTDPIRPIFAGLLRRHLQHYNNLKDLN